LASEKQGAELEVKRRTLAWYDSPWLVQFFEARDIIGRVAPHKLRDFVSSFEVFRVPRDFKPRFVPKFLSDDQLHFIREQIRSIPMARMNLREMRRFGRFIVDDWPAFTALQAELVDRVSELAGEVVEPSYNFLSLYKKTGVCQPHLDEPSAKWTLDICISQSAPWPINLSQVVPWPTSLAELEEFSADALRSDPSITFEQALLMEGDAVVFSGTNQWHYRDALPKGPGRCFCELLFLHYIPRGTSDLVDPRSWARIFDVAELAAIAEDDTGD
jgi:hypothetical protein